MSKEELVKEISIGWLEMMINSANWIRDMLQGWDEGEALKLSREYYALPCEDRMEVEKAVDRVMRECIEMIKED